MPTLALEIPETYDSITRPVVLSVAHELVRRLSLPAGTQVQYAGAIQAPAQPGSDLSERGALPGFPFTSKVYVEVSEQYLEDATLATAVKRPEHLPVFTDRGLRVAMTPVYIPTQLTISFRYRAPDRVSAERWRDELHRRASEGRAEELHELNYHYAIPKVFLVLLTEFFERRESVAGYGDDLQTYLREHFTDRATGLTTLVGSEPVLAISEYQVGALGWFDFMAEPNPSEMNDGGSWEAGFDYTLTYDKVTSMVIDYPIMMHNQLLDERFRPSEGPYTLDQHYRQPSWSRFLLDHFTPLYSRTLQRVGGIIVPEFDDWRPKNVPASTSGLFTALMGVDLNDPRAIMNLHELGDYQLSPTTLAFLQGEAPHLTQHRQSFFHLRLFEYDEYLGSTAISVDNALEIRATQDLDPRRVYHCQLSLVIDPSVVDKQAIERLRRNPPACIEVIEALDLISRGNGAQQSYNGIGGVGTPGRPVSRTGTMWPGGGYTGGGYPGGGYTGGYPGGGSYVGPGSGRPWTYEDLKDWLVIIGGKLVTRDSLNDVFREIIRRINNRTTPRAVGSVLDVKELQMSMRTVMQTGIIVHKVSQEHANYYQQQTSAAQQTDEYPAHYTAGVSGGDGGYQGGTGVESTALRGGVSLADDLLSSGS